MRACRRFLRPVWLCLISFGLLWVIYFALQNDEPPIEVFEETPIANEQNIFHRTQHEQYIVNHPKSLKKVKEKQIVGFPLVSQEIRGNEHNNIVVNSNDFEMRNNFKINRPAAPNDVSNQVNTEQPSIEKAFQIVNVNKLKQINESNELMTHQNDINNNKALGFDSEKMAEEDKNSSALSEHSPSTSVINRTNHSKTGKKNQVNIFRIFVFD